MVQAAGLVRGLRNAFPDATLVLSTTNHAFLDVAQRMSGLDACIYTPWDVRRACARAVATLRPDVVVTVESAWNPVLLRQARRRGARTLLASGTLRGDYHLALPIAADASPGAAAPRRHRRDRRRGTARPRGARRARCRVQVLGDLRLDPHQRVLAADRAALAARVAVEPDDHVLVGGSVHPGEDTVLLDALPRFVRTTTRCD